ncbi:hypothetical protein EVAR_84032_1 [Eumeta japonica]|uniref:Uncharacterized protein n=1 Tax=Eumeta variegata TaxID=151549 RepID=A0A4C1X9C9_EUMVA|nr:hypothetical protein EVAR_84032_1 [Eumeta japonica]
MYRPSRSRLPKRAINIQGCARSTPSVARPFCASPFANVRVRYDTNSEARRKSLDTTRMNKFSVNSAVVKITISSRSNVTRRRLGHRRGRYIIEPNRKKKRNRNSNAIGNEIKQGTKGQRTNYAKRQAARDVGHSARRQSAE